MPYIEPSTIFGLYYVLEAAFVPITLIDVRASAQIKDLSAQVTLTQRYHLSPDAPDSLEASYSFPIPVRAAVYGFALVKQDGSKIVGVVQERDTARRTYDAAAEEGKLASLMVQDSPDVFTVSVGNILPNETVIVEISYATELTEDEVNDSVRLHVPAHIGDRYGSSPIELVAAAAAASSSDAFFTLSTTIESATAIAQIGCPSHTVEITLGIPPTLVDAVALPSSHYAQLTFTSETTLDRDIIITVKSSGLDSPRCIAETHPSHETIALSLTMVPKFTLPDVTSQEFVFLVDRSGSMHGSRIETAKRALVVLLRSLPHTGTVFNVVGFGDQSSALWSASKPYDQKTLDKATKHVDGLAADLGGTEIARALEEVFKSRKTDRPTSLFVLTDGDAWDLGGVLEAVKAAVAAAPLNAFLRVFTLGIGNSASTAMVEGLARVGNGVASFVSDGEAFTGKANRLLKAARSPLVTNIRLDWGADIAAALAKERELLEAFEIVPDTSNVFSIPVDTTPISLFDPAVDALNSTPTPLPNPPPIILRPSPLLQQFPSTISGISPANRLYVYTLLALPATSLPSHVTLKGDLASGASVELQIPITRSQLPKSVAIHTLAARKLIQDLEDGALGREDASDITKAKIVRLGTTYSLASTYTSLVAVDESESSTGKRLGPARPCSTVASDSTRCLQTRSHGFYKSAKKSARPFSGVRNLLASIGSVASQFGGGGSGAPRAHAAPAYLSAPSHGGASAPSAACAAPQSEMLAEGYAAPPSTTPSPTSLDSLVRLQSFNGSFATAAIALCGLSPAAVVAAVGAELGSTLAAMWYLETKLAADNDAWEGVWEKAKAFCLRVVGEVELEALRAKVAELV